MNQRKAVSTGSPYEPVVGISRAVRIGNVVAVAGTAPLGPDGKTVAARERTVKHLTILVLILMVSAAGSAFGQVQTGPMLVGTFRPSGPPKGPERRRVGPGCVVDLEQVYDVEGSLVGEMQLDFRIYVVGDCTKSPGTYDEHWISYGTYTIRTQDAEYRGALTYLATAKAGGKVEGRLTLDGEVSAELDVTGEFADGFMNYKGMRLRSWRR